MKKLTSLPSGMILPIIVLLTILFFSPQKANAQTDAECYRVYQKEGYKCLQTRTKCTQSCSSLNNLKACADSCAAQDKTCSEQASTDLTACKAAIPKDKEDVPSKAESGQDCRKIFDKESYKCLGVSGDCQRECSEKTKRPDGGTYFNSGEIYSKCTKASDCDGKGRACNEQALANFRACGKPQGQSEDAVIKKEIPSTDQAPQPYAGWFVDKLPLFMQDWLDVFSTGHGLLSFFYDTATIVSESFVEGDKQEVKEEEEARDYIYSLSDDYIKNVTGLGKEEILKRQPSIGDEVIKQLKHPAQDSPFILDVLKGQAEVKYPGSNTWSPLKAGDKIPPGATIFTGMDASTVLSIKDKGVIQILPFTQIVVSEEGLDRAVQEKKTTTEIKLNMGDIEVSIPGGVFTGTLQITTPSSTTSVRGTHFWVTHNKDKNTTTVGVYEGKVEVKPTGRKGAINIIPGKEGPGILVVSQKFSPLKLALVGVALVVVIGGTFLIVRRKFASKGSSKKKK